MVRFTEYGVYVDNMELYKLILHAARGWDEALQRDCPARVLIEIEPIPMGLHMGVAEDADTTETPVRVTR
jgi:hypothetical protein